MTVNASPKIRCYTSVTYLKQINSTIIFIMTFVKLKNNTFLEENNN